MNTTETEPTRPQRFAGAAIALIISIGALVATLLILEASGVDERTTLFVSKAFTYSCLGVAMIGWKWPQAVFAPFKRLLASVVSACKNSTEKIQDEVSTTQSGIRRNLRTPLQRGIFAAACSGLVPWVFMRLISELWRSDGFADYLRNTFVAPVSPWFESGWWWYTKLEWYDWTVLPSLIGFCLAFTWPRTGGRLVEWVRGSK